MPLKASQFDLWSCQRMNDLLKRVKSLNRNIINFHLLKHNYKVICNKNILNILTYCDGEKSLLEISNILNIPFWDLRPIIYYLVELDLIEKIK